MKGDVLDYLNVVVLGTSFYLIWLNIKHLRRDEKAFDKLVEDIIGSEMALRAVVKNAELLIFPSTVLPAQYRSEFGLFLFFSDAYCKIEIVFKFLNCSEQDFKRSIICGESSEESRICNWQMIWCPRRIQMLQSP